MTFVTLWRLSVMIFVAIWRLLHYDFCHHMTYSMSVMTFVALLCLSLMMFVAFWCLSLKRFDGMMLMTFVAVPFVHVTTYVIYVQCSNNLSVFSVRHTTVLFFCFIPFIFTVIYRSRLLHSEHQEFFYLVCFTLIRALLLLYSVQCTIVTYLACFLCYNM